MEVEHRLRLAAGSSEELTHVLHDHAREVLLAVVENPRLTEEQALVLLSRKDLPLEVLKAFASREGLLRSYGIKLALARHPRTPRALSLPLLRHLYLADLAAVALSPAVPGDVKRAAEDGLVARVKSLSAGERINLARRGSGRLAGALLHDADARVFVAALDNPRLTQDLVLRALSLDGITAEAVEAIAGHARWSSVYDVRLALLRHPLTGLGRVLSLATQVKKADLREILADPRMPANRRTYLARQAQAGTRLHQA
jgi:hypothetical protein